MTSSVTLTFDPAASKTTVHETGARPFRCAEPDGIVGLCATGSLYSRCGWSVTYRIVRRRAAAVSA